MANITCFSCITQNTSDGLLSNNSNGENTTGDSRQYDISQVLDRYVTTTFCVLGCIGNIINLLVLTVIKRRKPAAARDDGATTGLIILAISDMAFCLVLLPRGFISSRKSFFTTASFWLYYQAYGSWLVTTFILSSTWITVTIATIRYLAICHPLHSRRYLSGSSLFNWICYLVAFGFGFLLNLPSFWQYQIVQYSENIYLIDIGSMSLSSTAGKVYHWIKVTLGLFIPGIFFMFCNASLIIALRQSRLLHSNTRRNSDTRGSCKASSRITILLVTIATSFVILVFPSELIDFFHGMLLKNTLNRTILPIARAVTNILQVINFSLNFIFYCCLNVQFRKVLLSLSCLACSKHSKRHMKSNFENEWLKMEHCGTTSTRASAFEL